MGGGNQGSLEKWLIPGRYKVSLKHLTVPKSKRVLKKKKKKKMGACRKNTEPV